MIVCKNCGNSFIGKYCNICGQKIITKRMTVRSVLGKFLSVVFLIESPLARTVKVLFTRPGAFVREYIEGKRRGYMEPIQFFMLTVTISLIVYYQFHPQVMSIFNIDPVDSGQIGNAQIKEKVAYLQELIKNNLTVLNFMLPPVFAGFISLLYRKRFYNYAENLLFSFFMVGGGYVISAVIGLMFAAVGTYDDLLGDGLTIVYYIYAIAGFTENKSVWGVIKNLLLVMFGFLVFGMIIAAGTALYLYATIDFNSL